MNQTANYQLKKWDKQDRILMQDFNDNSDAIDAALGDLNQTAHLQTIRTVLTEESSSYVIVSLEDLDWTQWKTIYIDILPAAGSSTSMYVCYDTSYANKIAACDTKWNRLVLFPLGQPDIPACLVSFGKGGRFFDTQVTYRNLFNVVVAAESGLEKLMAGSEFTIRGERL